MAVSAVLGLAPYEFFGVRLVGVTPENGRKLLLSLGVIVGVVLVRKLLGALVNAMLGSDRLQRARFWARQALSAVAALVITFVVISLWFDDPTRLTTALGLVTAGLAFALQKVVTAVAGYVVIIRGKTFGVGDRIVMGGVRGDVVGLTFTQTMIMEMGQPPPVQHADPAMWVKGRQYTGRMVTVSNSRVFDEPVFNYTREFPYLWEELAIPIAYDADRERVERLLLEVARAHTAEARELGDEERRELARRYLLKDASTEPRVYWRMTDNWLEMAVRFVTKEHGVRDLKDAMTRDILRGLDEAGIAIASATFEITGLPTLELGVAASSPPTHMAGGAPQRAAGHHS